MAVNSISSLTKLRLTGLSSGMDTDAIIKSMMQIEQLKINRQYRSRTTLQWKQEALSGIASDLKAFRQEFTRVDGAKSLMKEAAYNTYKADVTGKNASCVTIATTVNAKAGNVTIDSIISLAKGAEASSTGITSSSDGLGSNASQTKLKNLNLGQPLSFENGMISFGINSASFTFSEDDTLGHMLNTINSSSAGVEMSYSDLTNGFSIKSEELGVGSRLQIQNFSGNAFSLKNPAFGIKVGNYDNGTNAVVKFSGGQTVTRITNDFTLDGIKYTLNKVTPPDNEPIDISVTKDVQPAVDKIKEFVDGYNTMVSKLYGLLTDRKSRDEADYGPLTDDEKAEMTEKQIEQWEAIAKKGILKSDAGIQSVLSRLRGALYETVGSVGMSPADIGLSIDTYDKSGKLLKDGQITLNEDRLRAALEKDPNAVMRLFTDMSNADDRSVEYKESGLMMRIGMIFDDYTKGSSELALEGLDRSMRQVSEKITSMLDKMKEKEERLYRQYAAMETALSKIQSQSDWLSNTLGSMNG